jgi:stress response protein YsnF
MANNAELPIGEAAVTIPVLQEELSIGTRTVDTGRGVRISKTVTELPFEVNEILHRDEVSVRHVPIDRIVAVGEAPASRHEGDTLIIPIVEEVLVVERRLRIKEELHVTTTRREEHYAETVMLKSEQVHVERFDEASDN